MAQLYALFGSFFWGGIGVFPTLFDLCHAALDLPDGKPAFKQCFEIDLLDLFAVERRQRPSMTERDTAFFHQVLDFLRQFQQTQVIGHRGTVFLDLLGDILLIEFCAL